MTSPENSSRPLRKIEIASRSRGPRFAPGTRCESCATLETLFAQSFCTLLQYAARQWHVTITETHRVLTVSSQNAHRATWISGFVNVSLSPWGLDRVGGPLVGLSLVPMSVWGYERPTRGPPTRRHHRYRRAERDIHKP